MKWRAGRGDQVDSVWDGEAIVATLADAPPLDRLDQGLLGRLAMHAEPVLLAPGDQLCARGEPAKRLWLIQSGELNAQTGSGRNQKLSAGFVGEEAAIGAAHYFRNVSAKCRSRLLALPLDALPYALVAGPSQSEAFGRSLIDSLLGWPDQGDWKNQDTDEHQPTPAVFWPVWVLALMVPAVVLVISQHLGHDWSQRYFAAAAAGGALLWMARLTPPYVAALLTMLACLTMGIVPPRVVLSGFASNSFFMTLSIFAIAAVLMKSQLVRRAFLSACSIFGRLSGRGELVFGVGSMLLAIVLPARHDRLGVVASILRDGLKSMDRTRTRRITLAAYMGAAYCAPIFLTSGTLNLLLYGMMPEQAQFGISWLSWFAAAALPFALMVVAYTFVLYYLGPRERGGNTQPVVPLEFQYHCLGPVTSREWLIVAGVIAFMAAMIGVSLHMIDHRLISVTVLAGFIVLGILKGGQINRDIDWSFLLLLGSSIGLMNVFSHQGIARLGWLSDEDFIRLFVGNYPVFSVCLLAALAFILVTRLTMAPVLLAFPAITIADQGGIHPWVVVFVLLLANNCARGHEAEMRFHAFWAAFKQDGLIPVSLGRLQGTSLVIHLLAFLVSIPYWQYLGLL